MKVTEAINKFKNYTEVTKSKGTQEYYVYYLKVIEDNIGNLECDNVNSDVILQYVKERKGDNPEVSNATLNKHIAAIKTVIKYATDREIKFNKLKERKKIIPTVSVNTHKKIFSYYEKHLDDKFSFRNYLFFRILLDTGLRLSEITNLRIIDLELEENLIHVRTTKTDVDRYVAITRSTKVLLNKFLILQDVNNYIFTNFKDDEPMSTSSVESFVYRIKKKLKIKENITPHKWRHTFATNFLRSGGNIETLRILMGHSNLKTTQKYLHLSKQDILTEYKRIMENYVE